MSQYNNSSCAIRKRNVYKSEKTYRENINNANGTENPIDVSCTEIKSPTYWLTRIILLRSIGFIYVIAFAVAYFQNKQLIGKNGLLPMDKYLNDIKKHSQDNYWLMLEYAPTFYWLFDYQKYCDLLLNVTAISGLCLSAIVFTFGCANVIIMFILWILYHSLVAVGQNWYSFGWESQLLETGFLAIFLCPLFSLKRLPDNSKPSFFVIMCFRWLIFRIMIGAGLIKLRGDKCWKDLTCMNYHYQTQPVPNPMSYYMHQSPEQFHKFETLSNHFIELIAPFFLLFPRGFAAVGGIFQIFFQVVLIISGNLSFLNWLTIVPSLSCFDDKMYSVIFSKSTVQKVITLQNNEKREYKSNSSWKNNLPRRIVDSILAVLIGYLSIFVVMNLLSPNQKMNHSFTSLRLVNTYGAFGSVTKARTEVIFQGTSSSDPNSPDAKWLEYEFNCKPGMVSRRPCLISPYHYRLDWLMWFAAFQDYQHNEWLVHLAAKFLVNDEGASSLIAYNPFNCSSPPQWIRAEHYKYQYTKFGSSSDWWTRRRIKSYLPPVNLESLKPYLDHFNWTLPEPRRNKC